MTIPQGFHPGRVYQDQNGKLTIPDNASLALDGGTMVIGDPSSELDFPQIGPPTILRWPVGNGTFTFSKFFPFLFYLLDAWYINTLGAGGAGDQIEVKATRLDQAGDPGLFTVVTFDLSTVGNSDIVRMADGNYDSLYAIGALQKNYLEGGGLTQFQIASTMPTGTAEGIVHVMILPRTGNRAEFLGP